MLGDVRGTAATAWALTVLLFVLVPRPGTLARGLTNTVDDLAASTDAVVTSLAAATRPGQMPRIDTGPLEDQVQQGWSTGQAWGRGHLDNLRDQAAGRLATIATDARELIGRIQDNDTKPRTKVAPEEDR